MKASESTQSLIEILKELNKELVSINEIQNAVSKIASASHDRITAIKATMDQINTALQNVVEHNKTVTFTETED